MRQPLTPPKMIIEHLVFRKERKAIAHTIVRVLETTRDDFFPSMTTQDFVLALSLLEAIYEQNERGFEASASGLARATGYPRGTVRRKLQDLDKKWHAIEQRGHRYVLNAAFFNSEQTFSRALSRWRKIKGTAELLNEEALSAKACSRKRPA